MFRSSDVFLLSLVIMATTNVNAQSVLRDMEYATTTAPETYLKLDLYRPSGEAPSRLIVWIHGGAWRAGSKSQMPIGFLVEHGYAVASVDYRLSPVARFPAQVHDIRAAIRFLRAGSERLRLNTDRIGVAGLSAGGHLAALVGVTNGHEKLEGQIGDHVNVSSDVHAIVDYYGPTNFHTILQQSTPHGLSVRVPALKLLIGGRPEEHQTLATLGSATAHVDKDDPPLLLIHGDQDPQVPINQSHELHGLYKDLGLDVAMEVVHGGAHGGPLFFDDTRNAMVTEFFDRTLGGPSSAKQPN